MALGKCFSGAALQVAFELPCLEFTRKSHVTNKPPRSSVHGGLVLASVVRGKACPQILCKASIVVTGVDSALQDVHVVHE